MDQEIPDYDLDSEDENWVNKQSKKLEMDALKFETMMDRLEKGSGQTVSSSGFHNFSIAVTFKCEQLIIKV